MANGKRNRARWAAAGMAWMLAATALGAKEIPPPPEKKLSGTVVGVEQRECDICKCVELSLTLKTRAGRFEVRLGPKAFFEEHDFAILRGDVIQVSGFVFDERGKEIVLANEVRKGGERLILRGKYGKPAWLEAHGHTCPVCGN